MVRPLMLPADCPSTTICAVELTLLTGAKAAFIACYLPQPIEEHAQVCKALANLPHALPHQILILGGDLQGDWDGTSPKTQHITSLPFVRWTGPTTPTFQPRHQPEQASCIDHLTIRNPTHVTQQIGNTQNLSSAFLDHHGVLGRISIPILTAEAVAPPIPQPPWVPMFQYPIPEHTLETWKSKVTIDSFAAILLAKATALSLKDSLEFSSGVISLEGV